MIDAGERVVSLVAMCGKTKTGGVDVEAAGSSSVDGAWTGACDGSSSTSIARRRCASAGLDPQSSQPKL